MDIGDADDLQRFFAQPVICGLKPAAADADASQAEVTLESDPPSMDLSDALVAKIDAYRAGLTDIDPRVDVNSNHLTRAAADASALAKSFGDEGQYMQVCRHRRFDQVVLFSRPIAHKENLLRALHDFHARVALVLKDAEGSRRALMTEHTLATALKRENAKLKVDVKNAEANAHDVLAAAEATVSQLQALRASIQPLQDSEEKARLDKARAEKYLAEERKELGVWKKRVADYKGTVGHHEFSYSTRNETLTGQQEKIQKTKIKELQAKLAAYEKDQVSQSIEEARSRKRLCTREGACVDKENDVLEVVRLWSPIRRPEITGCSSRRSPQESQSLIVLPEDMSYSTASDMDILPRALYDNFPSASSARRSPPPPSPPIHRPTFGLESRPRLLGPKAARTAGTIRAFKVPLVPAKKKVVRRPGSTGLPLDIVDGRPRRPVVTGPIKSRRLQA